jgi:hypothetical protein
MRILVSIGLTETADTRTNRSRPVGTGAGNSISTNESGSEIGSDFW